MTATAGEVSVADLNRYAAVLKTLIEAHPTNVLAQSLIATAMADFDADHSYRFPCLPKPPCCMLDDVALCNHASPSVDGRSSDAGGCRWRNGGGRMSSSASGPADNQQRRRLSSARSKKERVQWALGEAEILTSMLSLSRRMWRQGRGVSKWPEALGSLL